MGRALYCLSCERALVGEHLAGYDIGVEIHRAVARRGDLNMMPGLPSASSGCDLDVNCPTVPDVLTIHIDLCV